MKNNQSVSKIMKKTQINDGMIYEPNHEKLSVLKSTELNFRRNGKISIVFDWSKFCSGWTYSLMCFFLFRLFSVCVLVKCLWYYSLDLNSFEPKIEFYITCKIVSEVLQTNHDMNHLCWSKTRHLIIIPLKFF